ncbi:pancreatic lipase-related protein 2-like [Sitophilus oryzae]|uniref:Pancreatic lipase-related protein 2-like n=1 Tax=Sitophilus oryzae TaxID=7048 RepID=A0A6J2XRS4_SITOR|nr:pancreatic lipase-related protein 2-like [Sitophilus oryzae]
MSAAVGTMIGLSMLAAGALYVSFKAVTDEINKNSDTESDNITKSYLLISSDGEDTQYILFTRDHSPYNIRRGDFETLSASGFNISNPTKIITHGFLSGIQFEVFTLIKDAYLNVSDYNVIGLDWSVLCRTEYVSAIRGARTAGDDLGEFIKWLVLNGVSLDDIHLIGHSLGAHVVGVGGSKVKDGKVGRITGLDPAGPGYGDISEDLRLDPQDAKLVDVVHTFMRVIGITRPLGHVDFYPNGGRYQPGCPDINKLKPTETIFCNHGRSYQLFAESIINSKAFNCKKCSSLEDALYSRCLEDTDVYMGQSETYKYGLYYFKTNAESPYSLDNINDT